VISRYQSLADHLLREIDGWCQSWRGCGYIEDWRLEWGHHDNAARLEIMLCGGGTARYSLSAEEFMMDGWVLIGHWYEAISREIRARSAIGRPLTRIDREGNLHVLPQERNYGELEYLTRRYADWADRFAGYPGQFEAASKESDQKSRDLFRSVAGESVYQALDTKGVFQPIVGSKGTKYSLHKRATFCVERLKDGAKLCAVVPGVPLWDHLLGIKLMIEHDEPKFLKTANVSGGHPRGFFRGMEFWR